MKFLKIKKFNVKAESLDFRDAEFMSSDDKKKVYKNFVAFLNNHFKDTLFTRALYNHLHLHSGFIAHYNINGFYAEYFAKAAIFHKTAYDSTIKNSEYMGIYPNKYPFKGVDSIETKEIFFDIFQEIRMAKDGIGAFYSTIMNNRNYGGNNVYADLDDAIKKAFNDYLSLFKEEIKKAVKINNSQIKKIPEKIKEEIIVVLKKEEPLSEPTSLTDVRIFNKVSIQTSMFDFI